MFFVVCGFAPTAALALGPENLLLIVNKNVPESRRLAEHYAHVRHVPDGRILALDLPPGDEMPFDQYETEVVPAIRAFLRENNLKSQVTCLVTFYGTPLRIGGRADTLELRRERFQLDEALANAARELEPIVERSEALATQVNPSFTPFKGNDVNALARR